MTKRCIFFTAAAAFLYVTPVSAQTIPSPYDFVDRSQALYAYGTYVLTDRGTIGTGPGSGPAIGAGYSIRVSGPFNVDGRVAFFPTSRTVYTVVDADPEQVRNDPMVGLEEIGEADLSLLLADASLRFDITGPRTWRSLQPYALLGAGLAVRVASDQPVEEELPPGTDLRVRFQNGVTGHFGGGVEWHLAERFTVRFDARNLLLRLHVPTGFITPDRVIDDRQWVLTGHFSVGAGFRF